MINGIRLLLLRLLLLLLLLLQLLCCLKSRADLQAENLMLRHQIGVLRRCRSASRRVRTTGIDRVSFVWLYRLWPTSLNALQIIHPKTLVRWHRQGFQSVLVLEVSLPRRKTQSQCRAPGACPGDRQEKPTLGCASHPWRTARVGVQRRSGNGIKVSATPSSVSGPALEDFSEQSPALRGLDRRSRGSNRVVQTAERPRRIEPSTPATRSSLGYTEPDRQLDGSADAGGLPLGGRTGPRDS